MTVSEPRSPIGALAAGQSAPRTDCRHARPEPAPGFWLVHELDGLARSGGLAPVQGRHARPAPDRRAGLAA